jgi:phosphoribosylformimino-5-aminoimidazole carboxamide ribotide isomerase
VLIFPAIDLKEGKCVRLEQGIMSTAVVYGENPAEVARHWQAEGAEWLHVVDLDGAFARSPRNREAVAAIVRSVNCRVQVGGGIRTLETLSEYLELGVERVVLGSAAHGNPDLLVQACASFPGRVVLGIDSRSGQVAVEGWSQTVGLTPLEMVRNFQYLDLAAIVYTDIQRDGMQTGPNIEATRALARAAKIPVIASGGVGRLEHVAGLAALEPEGVAGVIIGRALYTGSIELAEAIAVARGRKATL